MEKSEKRWFLRVVIFAGIMLLGVVSYAIYGEFQKKQRIESEIQELKNEAQKLSQRNSELLEQITYFESRDFKEKEAKDKLNMQDPSESMVMIKPSPSKELSDLSGAGSQIAIETQGSGQKLSNPQKWWNYFFKY